MLCVLLLSFVSINIYAANSDWQLRSISDVADNPKLTHFVWEVDRPPYGELDKIKLHRVVAKGKMLFNRKVILMLPGTWSAGGWSEITDPDINTMLFLANNDYDVYVMDYRSANVPGMDYAQLAEYGIDVAGTGDWTYGVFREDIKASVDFIKKISTVDKIFMSGFSRGGYHMFIYARKYPEDLEGMVVLDINIKDLPPSGEAMDEATYNMMVNLFKAGLVPDPFTGQPIGLLGGVFFLSDLDYQNWKLAGVLPYSKNLVGGPLPAGFEVISDYVADNVHNLWNPLMLGEGALANYHGGYIDRDVLVKVINEFSRYYPYIQSIEDKQMAAYDDVPYLDYDDGTIDLPAIAFLSPYVGCPGNICLLGIIPNVTTSADVTINFLSNYGHMDIMCGSHSLTDVKQPMLEWLDNHMSESASRLSWQSNDHPLLDSLLKSLVTPLFQVEENR
jgi:pimeloyl-ACP methyl ester carboxylesterase